MSIQMLMPSKQPQVPFVDLGAQYRTIEGEIGEATSRVIQQSDFILGREVSLFEEEFAAFCEAKYAIGVDSGTSALELPSGHTTSDPATKSLPPRTASSLRRWQYPTPARGRSLWMSIHPLTPWTFRPSRKPLPLERKR